MIFSHIFTSIFNSGIPIGTFEKKNFIVVLDELMHSKWILADGLVLLGSANVTGGGLGGNTELELFTNSCTIYLVDPSTGLDHLKIQTARFR